MFRVVPTTVHDIDLFPETHRIWLELIVNLNYPNRNDLRRRSLKINLADQPLDVLYNCLCGFDERVLREAFQEYAREHNTRIFDRLLRDTPKTLDAHWQVFRRTKRNYCWSFGLRKNDGIVSGGFLADARKLQQLLPWGSCVQIEREPAYERLLISQNSYPLNPAPRVSLYIAGEVQHHSIWDLRQTEAPRFAVAPASPAS